MNKKLGAQFLARMEAAKEGKRTAMDGNSPPKNPKKIKICLDLTSIIVQIWCSPYMQFYAPLLLAAIFLDHTRLHFTDSMVDNFWWKRLVDELFSEQLKS